MPKKQKKNQDNWIYTYYQGINDGTFLVGDFIHRLYEYLIQGLQNKEFFFDGKKANGAIEWIESHCYHTEGDLAPSLIKLETWQKAMISCIFGIVDANGKRQFREIFLVIGRKNGKSKLASSIAEYMFRVEGGFGTRIFCIAPKLDQTDIIYNDIWQMIQLDPEYQALKEEFSVRDHNRIVGDNSALPRHRMSDLAIPDRKSVV